MTIPPVFDISRLIARAHHATPTGIDRFELHYARWFGERLGRRAVFIETWPRGPSIVHRERACALIGRLSLCWGSRVLSPEQSARLGQLLAAIDGAATQPASRLADSRCRGLLRRAASLTRSFHVTPPPGSALLHVSHARLDRGSAYAWLGPHRRSVFYVHDLIPLTHGQFVRAGEAERHLRRIDTVFRHADLILCNSKVTADALSKLAARLAVGSPQIAVVPPGIDEVFLDLPQSQAASTKHPYFVCVGTIEGRKNHAMLLDVWRRLVEESGSDAPRLVIVGRRGWKNAHVVAALDRAKTFRGSVLEATDLDDAALARLVAGASALLAPSFVEGYDMPSREALALGTPVIASDIATHREVLRQSAILIDPSDVARWQSAIEAQVKERRRVDRSHRPKSSWDAHFKAVEAVMACRAALKRPAGDVLPLTKPPRTVSRRAFDNLGGEYWHAQ